MSGSSVPISQPSPSASPAEQNVALTGGAAALGALGYYQTADVQRKFELASATGPLLRLLDAESAHRAGIVAAKLGLFPKETRPDPESLRVSLWGRSFSNPIGESTSTRVCSVPTLEIQDAGIHSRNELSAVPLVMQTAWCRYSYLHQCRRQSHGIKNKHTRMLPSAFM